MKHLQFYTSEMVHLICLIKSRLSCNYIFIVSTRWLLPSCMVWYVVNPLERGVPLRMWKQWWMTVVSLCWVIKSLIFFYFSTLPNIEASSNIHPPLMVIWKTHFCSITHSIWIKRVVNDVCNLSLSCSIDQH